MPPTPIAYPLVNGHRHSYASVEIGLLGKIYRGVKSVDYADSLKPGKLYGTGPEVVGRTRGQYEPKASIELYRAEFENLLADLTAGGLGFGEVAFDITVTYGDESTPTTTTDTIEACRITDPSTAGTEGTDPTTVKLELDPLRILWNGAAIFTAGA